MYKLCICFPGMRVSRTHNPYRHHNNVFREHLAIQSCISLVFVSIMSHRPEGYEFPVIAIIECIIIKGFAAAKAEQLNTSHCLCCVAVVLFVNTLIVFNVAARSIAILFVIGL